jgi:hypothetical protein
MFSPGPSLVEENVMITTAYSYNDAQPEWMYAIGAAWEAKTDLGDSTKSEIFSEWRLGSIKLVVEYDLLIEEAKKRGPSVNLTSRGSQGLLPW